MLLYPFGIGATFFFAFGAALGAFALTAFFIGAFFVDFVVVDLAAVIFAPAGFAFILVGAFFVGGFLLITVFFDAAAFFPAELFAFGAILLLFWRFTTGTSRAIFGGRFLFPQRLTIRPCEETQFAFGKNRRF